MPSPMNHVYTFTWIDGAGIKRSISHYEANPEHRPRRDPNCLAAGFAFWSPRRNYSPTIPSALDNPADEM